MEWNFDKPIKNIIGLVVLFSIYAALFPTLVNAVTSLAALTGLGVFSSIIGLVVPLILGAVLLIIVIAKIMDLRKA